MKEIEIVKIEKDELRGLKINYSFYDSAYGQTLVASTGKGICYIGFGEREHALQAMSETYRGADFSEKYDDLHLAALDFIESGKSSHFVLHVSGTDFQIGVWKALIGVPLGKLSTYKRIADDVEKPKAVRAVGSAVGSNPVSCIIPCHRIVRTDGGLGGYHWGLDLKKEMLEREKQLVK